MRALIGEVDVETPAQHARIAANNIVLARIVALRTAEYAHADVLFTDLRCASGEAEFAYL